MKNIPVYITEYGTATLILREIPHREIAYILLQSALPGHLEDHAAQCAAFCRSCGAKTCLVSPGRDVGPPALPHAHDIYRLHTYKDYLPVPDAPVLLAPVDASNDAIFQRIYNQCFRSVSNAATCDRDHLALLRQPDRQGFLALTDASAPYGIGELWGSELAAVGLLPEYRGGGQALTLSLLARCPGPEVTLTVASDNDAAIRLYDRLGFTVTETVSRWYYA